jgi:DNA-directed RNA polymerase subunit F
MQKIKAHLIEFPNDKCSEIAKVFDVDVQKVYDAKESLRRHKMLPRTQKRFHKKIAKVVQTVQPKMDTEVELRYKLANLTAENERLKAIIAYLETAAGIRKAA